MHQARASRYPFQWPIEWRHEYTIRGGLTGAGEDLENIDATVHDRTMHEDTNHMRQGWGKNE
jgi:hypothetical protein